MKLVYMFKSLKFFLSNRFKKREYDIVFYYPSHFNRGEKGENIFFKPFYELCEKHNLSYLVFEEPELHNKTTRNEKATPFDFMLLTILVLRKIIPLKKFDSFEHREWFIAKIVRPLFFKKFDFKNYIVLSNSMLGFFRGLNPNASLYDYQHGVIFSGHTGYFTSANEAIPHIKQNRANLLVYGKGFQNLLKKNCSDGYYGNHTYSIGIGKKMKIKNNNIEKNKILFSLQFTSPSDSTDKQYGWVATIHDFFEKNKNYFIDNHLEIIMKHHPRFDKSIDIEPLRGYEFAKFHDGNLNEAFEESFLHITFYSTTVFEASAKAIPTILWKHATSNAEIYVKDFDYPLGTVPTDQIVNFIDKHRKNDASYRNDCKKVHEWYKKVFSPLNEKLFLELFKAKKSEI